MTKEKLIEIANQYATPAYVFDLEIVKEKIDLIRNMLPAHTGLCFAVKANPFLISAVWKLVDRLEVCSPGEYERCISAQVSPDKIIVSGVNKSYDSMKRILSYSHGAGIYTIESKQHYDILSLCAKELGRKLDVLIRLSSGNQFGVDEQCWIEIAKQVVSDDNLNLIGVHYYAGTQKKQTRMEKELRMLDEFAKNVLIETGVVLEELEYGAWLAVSYFESDSENEREHADCKIQLSGLSDAILSMQSYEKTTIELGRFLMSDCGYYITSIVDKKTNDGTSYLITDGGIHQLSYYGWMMGMKRPLIMELDKSKEQEAKTVSICGSLCTVNDVLVRETILHAPEIGDRLAFERCGAYACTEGMAMFLSRELPQLLLYQLDGSVHVLRGCIDTHTII